jgi:hypothetical protein
LRAFLGEIQDFVGQQAGRPGLATEVAALGEAASAIQRAVGALLELFVGGQLDQVTMVANAFLEMMAEVTLAHLLLEAAVAAEARSRPEQGERRQEDLDFYRGKIMAAKYFVNYVLPGVHLKLGTILAGDRSALDIPDRGFSTAH